MPQLLNKEENKTEKKPYAPEGDEKNILDHLELRIPVLKQTKKKIINDIDFEQIMKDADREYQPHSLREKRTSSSNVMLVQDEVKGLRGSRIVPITGKEGSEWRSDVSEPTLLVKIQTAISILVDQNPEAVFKAVLKKYKPTSAIANAIWKRSWNIARSKEQLKLFIFDLAKYGWAVGRTYPRIVQREKEILIELDVEHPEKNKYKKVTITEFNDIYREKLDPYRTWIDDMTNLTDPWSLDDWYFEMDFSKDAFDLEFGQYENADKVTFGQKTSEATSDEEDGDNEQKKQRTDLITVGFYESKKKDLYAIYSPKDKVVIYASPLPNDDGMLSLWHTYWTERDPRTPYGIGLYEIIKNNKVMYDRLDNMDMDSLVMSIYTMLFFSGSNSLNGDGNITVSPGLMKQKLPGTTVDQIKIDYTGKGREGAQQQLERMDETTGITPTLQGQVEGKTLGEVLHAKDAALKRLNIPLSNIASGFIEQDAYITLSWANQIYSLPEVMEFVDDADLEEFKTDTEREPTQVTKREDGTITADFPRVLELSLDDDRDGTLIESPENRFFIIGKDIEKKAIKWKGQITVNPQSIIAPSQELDRQRKLELFNLVTPIVQVIATSIAQGALAIAAAMAKPVVQILEIQNEKPEDWLPDEIIVVLNAPPGSAKKIEEKQKAAAEATATEEAPLFVDPNSPEAQAQAVAEGGAPELPSTSPSAPGGVGSEIPSAPSENGPGINPVVPQDEVTGGGKRSLDMAS